MDDCYLGIAKLAQYADVSESMLRKWLHDPAHPLPHYRVGDRIVVKRSEFDEWLARGVVRLRPRTLSLQDDAKALVAGIRRR